MRMSFNELLKKYRIEIGLSQREFAFLAGVDQGHYSRIESGLKNPPKKNTVVKMAKMLKLDKSQFSEFLNAAGYSDHHRVSVSGYSSPIQIRMSKWHYSTIKSIGRLDGEGQKAINDLVQLLSRTSLKSNELTVISKSIRSHIKNLKKLLYQLRADNQIGTD